MRKDFAGLVDRGGSVDRPICLGSCLANGLLSPPPPSPSSSSPSSSLMEGGRGCAASMPRVVLVAVGEVRGGRPGLGGEEEVDDWEERGGLWNDRWLLSRLLKSTGAALEVACLSGERERDGSSLGCSSIGLRVACRRKTLSRCFFSPSRPHSLWCLSVQSLPWHSGLQ